MQTLNAPQYEAITEADQWLCASGLPTYSRLRAVLWRISTLDPSDPEFISLVRKEALAHAQAATPSA
jgi:hypothetical protein